MTCRDARPLLWDYHDGACDEAARLQFEAHLTTCDSCRHELTQWTALTERVFPHRSERAPAFLWTRVLAGIETQEKKTAQAPWWEQWAWMSRVTVAATFALGLSAAYMFNSWSGSFDGLLSGQPAQQAALQLASARLTIGDEADALVLGDVE